jgi:hypothetical protein
MKPEDKSNESPEMTFGGQLMAKTCFGISKTLIRYFQQTLSIEMAL